MGANEHSGPKMWRISSSKDDPKEYELLLLDAPLLIVASLLSSSSPFPFSDTDSDEEEEEVRWSSKLCVGSLVALLDSEIGWVRGWVAGSKVVPLSFSG